MQEHTANYKQDTTTHLVLLFLGLGERAWEINPTQLHLTYLNLKGAAGCDGPVTLTWHLGLSSSMHQVT